MNKTAPLLHRADVDRVVLRYRQRIAEHGLTLASLNSGDADRQRLRHQVHAVALQTNRPSILDVGCGIASFYEYLKNEGRQCLYTGYDIVPEYVDYCRSCFPECHFGLRNIFDEDFGGAFDCIVMSQTFNNNYRFSDNLQVMRAALSLAYSNARISVSVDMLSKYAPSKMPGLFYYSPEEMFSFAKSLTSRVVLRHDYRPSEFCIQLFHETAEGFIA